MESGAVSSLISFIIQVISIQGNETEGNKGARVCVKEIHASALGA